MRIVETVPLLPDWWKCKLADPSRKENQQFTAGNHPTVITTHMQSDVCPISFTEALLIIIKNQDEIKHLSKGDKLNKF